ncbi:MAG: hypothetical protein JO154_11190 [Chitinophaga sp.]|uniref:hypothetical protein n=1 Tax=Chitinophaga sp. TaxID=1869181 RepID=UPI0025BABA73|nr:hypothetical protein [Chitinophaga sp.]MBV8253161.1 hypothetical protein [Chitinophaga sp.]
MNIKLIPVANWKVRTTLSKEEILQKVSNSTIHKTWKLSMKGLMQNNSFVSEPNSNGFILIMGQYGLSYAKNPISPALKVHITVEDNLTILNCKHRLSDNTFIGLITFYILFGVISYFMGYKHHDLLGGMILIVIACVHYISMLLNFNKRLFNYEAFINSLVKDTQIQ